MLNELRLKKTENVKSSVQKEHKVKSQVTVFFQDTPLLLVLKAVKSFSDESTPLKHAASRLRRVL